MKKYLWDVSMKACPPAWQDCSTDHNDLLAAGSTPVVGSSNKTSVGLPIKAIAMFKRLLLPPLYVSLGCDIHAFKSESIIEIQDYDDEYNITKMKDKE